MDINAACAETAHWMSPPCGSPHHQVRAGRGSKEAARQHPPERPYNNANRRTSNAVGAATVLAPAVPLAAKRCPSPPCRRGSISDRAVGLSATPGRVATAPTVTVSPLAPSSSSLYHHDSVPGVGSWNARMAEANRCRCGYVYCTLSCAMTCR